MEGPIYTYIPIGPVVYYLTYIHSSQIHTCAHTYTYTHAYTHTTNVYRRWAGTASDIVRLPVSNR